MFTVDEETVAEHVYSELALGRGKEGTVLLIRINNILQNIYISYKLYNICVYICGHLKQILLLNDQHELPS